MIPVEPKFWGFRSFVPRKFLNLEKSWVAFESKDLIYKQDAIEVKCLFNKSVITCLFLVFQFVSSGKPYRESTELNLFSSCSSEAFSCILQISSVNIFFIIFKHRLIEFLFSHFYFVDNFISRIGLY